VAARRALIIASYQYADSGLRQLVAPAHDAEAFAAVLKDPEIAGFDVTTLINEPNHVVGEAIADFYTNSRKDDLTVMYFTGHGLKDDAGRLYLAMTNTKRQALMWTAISAAQLNEAMEASPSRRKVLILDCCYSGAFPAGGAPKADEGVQTLERFHGKGRAVLTASDATQYAFEGDDVRGLGTSSVFTRYLVEAMRSGEADLDKDGDIALDELYSYVYDRVVTQMPQQRPKKQEDVDGRIFIARNVHWTIPVHLQNAIESPIAAQRRSAVDELAYLHRVGNDLVRSTVAPHLTALADDDSRAVSAAASAALLRIEGGNVPVETDVGLSRSRPTSPRDEISRQEQARIDGLQWVAGKAEDHARRDAEERAEREAANQERPHPGSSTAGLATSVATGRPKAPKRDEPPIVRQGEASHSAAQFEAEPPYAQTEGSSPYTQQTPPDDTDHMEPQEHPAAATVATGEEPAASVSDQQIAQTERRDSAEVTHSGSDARNAEPPTTGVSTGSPALASGTPEPGALVSSAPGRSPLTKESRELGKGKSTERTSHQATDSSPIRDTPPSAPPLPSAEEFGVGNITAHEAAPRKVSTRTLATVAAAGTAVTVAAVVLVANAGSESTSGPSVGESATSIPSTSPPPPPTASPTAAATSPTPLEVANSFIGRLPQEVQAMGCSAGQVQSSFSQVIAPQVECGSLDNRTAGYVMYDTPDAMNAHFDSNVIESLDPGDCASNSNAFGPYQVGALRGRVSCNAKSDGSFYIQWTDEVNLIWGASYCRSGTYAHCYQHWQSDVQIAPP